MADATASSMLHQAHACQPPAALDDPWALCGIVSYTGAWRQYIVEAGGKEYAVLTSPSKVFRDGFPVELVGLRAIRALKLHR
jgi:hypothetical protein